MKRLLYISGKWERPHVLSCVSCGSDDVEIIGEAGDDGYCESCTSPWTRFAIKCTKCGTAIGIKMY